MNKTVPSSSGNAFFMLVIKIKVDCQSIGMQKSCFTEKRKPTPARVVAQNDGLVPNTTDLATTRKLRRKTPLWIGATARCDGRVSKTYGIRNRPSIEDSSVKQVGFRGAIRSWVDRHEKWHTKEILCLPSLPFV
jgi:hypothetical protein